MSGAIDEARLAPVDGGRTARVAAVEAAARNRWVAILALRVLVGIAFLALWYVASGNWIDTLLISSPQNVAARLWRWALDGTLWNNLSVTLEATVLGFAIGCGAGFGLGLLFGRFQLLAEVFDPYITAIYSIPKIALAPLFIIWFGIGLESKVAVSASIVFFVIFLNTYTGVREVNPLYVHGTRIMGGGEFAVMRYVIIPSAAAWVITGLKVSVPYALVGTVVGEFMSSNRGIGFLISQATGLFNTTSVFAGIIVLAVVGALINTALKYLEAWVLRWLAVKGGMNPDRDLRLVPIQGGGPAIVAALSQQVIDGFCLSSPTSDLAVQKLGCAYLFNMVTNPPPELSPYTYIICNTAEKTLRDRRDALVRYLTGLALAMKSMTDEPAKFKAFAIPFLELDPAIAELAFERNASMYYKTPEPTEAPFKTNLGFINTANKTAGLDPMPASLTFVSMFDPSLASDAMKRL